MLLLLLFFSSCYQVELHGMYDGHGKSQLERHCRQGYILAGFKNLITQASSLDLSTSSRSFPFLTNWSNSKTQLFGLVQAMPTSPRT